MLSPLPEHVVRCLKRYIAIHRTDLADGICSVFSGPDADALLQFGYEDLAVTDIA